jgi:hypothetical protein
MKRLVTAIIPSVITILAIGFTLLTYLVPALAGLRPMLVELAVIVAAFAMLLGVINVLHVHGTNIIRRRGWFYSLVLLLSFVGVLLVALFDLVMSLNRVSGAALAQQATSGAAMTLMYQYILIPIQATLTALLPFFLAFAAYRTLRIRRTIGSTLGAVVFLITAMVVLLGQVPLSNLPPLVDNGLRMARESVIRVWAMAGMRGILLGVALGIIATALRVLIGADRPSSD